MKIAQLVIASCLTVGDRGSRRTSTTRPAGRAALARRGCEAYGGATRSEKEAVFDVDRTRADRSRCRPRLSQPIVLGRRDFEGDRREVDRELAVLRSVRRARTDGVRAGRHRSATYAYLCDVYVLEEYRARAGQVDDRDRDGPPRPAGPTAISAGHARRARAVRARSASTAGAPERHMEISGRDVSVDRVGRSTHQ